MTQERQETTDGMMSLVGKRESVHLWYAQGHPFTVMDGMAKIQDAGDAGKFWNIVVGRWGSSHFMNSLF